MNPIQLNNKFKSWVESIYPGFLSGQEVESRMIFASFVHFFVWI
ncbi:hypothetical protein [Globicatella sp. PHS-GS-PNBC-21-1553]|nr:hypothetical protein [Globicatella sp. PHS-GS-PNBC-21-1553]